MRFNQLLIAMVMAIAYLWPTSMGAQDLSKVDRSQVLQWGNPGGASTYGKYVTGPAPNYNTYYRDYYSDWADGSNHVRWEEYFEITKKTLTPDAPYIEFKFNHDTEGKHMIKGIVINVASSSTGSQWKQVLQMGGLNEHYPSYVSTEWGAVEMVGQSVQIEVPNRGQFELNVRLIWSYCIFSNFKILFLA